MAGDYIIDVGDKFEVLISDDKSIEGVMVIGWFNTDSKTRQNFCC